MGICHCYRQRGHMLSECSRKRRYSNCGEGFVKWMEVEKKDHKGLFHYCTRDCRYFKRCNKSLDKECPLHDNGESSGSTNGGEHVDDLSHMLKTLAALGKRLGDFSKNKYAQRERNFKKCNLKLKMY